MECISVKVGTLGAHGERMHNVDFKVLVMGKYDEVTFCVAIIIMK